MPLRIRLATGYIPLKTSDIGKVSPPNVFYRRYDTAYDRSSHETVKVAAASTAMPTTFVSMFTLCFRNAFAVYITMWASKTVCVIEEWYLDYVNLYRKVASRAVMKSGLIDAYYTGSVSAVFSPWLLLPSQAANICACSVCCKTERLIFRSTRRHVVYDWKLSTDLIQSSRGYRLPPSYPYTWN